MNLPKIDLKELEMEKKKIQKKDLNLSNFTPNSLKKIPTKNGVRLNWRLLISFGVNGLVRD